MKASSRFVKLTTVVPAVARVTKLGTSSNLRLKTKTMTLDERAVRRLLAAKKASAMVHDTQRVPEEEEYREVDEQCAHSGAGGGFDEDLSLTDSLDDDEKQKFIDLTHSAGPSGRRESTNGQRHEGSSRPEEKSHTAELPLNQSSTVEPALVVSTSTSGK
jgi:hypothetical protein